jgi:hypothetical protein
MRSWEGTGLQDRPENRRLLEAAVLVISSEIKNGTFDYLKHFPKGNKAQLFRPAEDLSPSHVIVETHFKGWIKKQAERVRAHRVKDYDAIRRYVLKLELANRPSESSLSVCSMSRTFRASRTSSRPRALKPGASMASFTAAYAPCSAMRALMDW